MKTQVRSLVVILMLLFFGISAQAKYTETMDPSNFTVNLVTDCGLTNDGAANDQSDLLEQAITDLDARGGGNIIIPKGKYMLSGVYLKSNIHILIDAGTIIKPAEGDGTIFSFTVPKSKTTKQDFIENVSVRGVGGSFIVDYHEKLSKDKQRAVVAVMVRNFMISDMDVKDNYSTYCCITLSLTSESGDISDWEVTRATDGTIQNIRHFRGSPAYGLVQCHGAQSCHFENLYSFGGVALRLEVGASYMHVGVYDITAKNLICEEGKITLMMGPHSAKCGVVTVEDVLSIGCVWAVSYGDGHVKENAPDQTPGYFSSDSSVKNIHAIFGKRAQIKGASLLRIPDPAYYDSLQIWSDLKFFNAPSLGAVSAGALTYSINLENITMEGFPYRNDSLIIKDGEGYRPGKWGRVSAEWIATHEGEEWYSQQGVSNDDYDIPAREGFPFFPKLPTSSKDLKSLNSSLLVFPNPVKNEMNIRGCKGSKNVHVQLYDLRGSLISQKQFVSNVSDIITFPVSDVVPGTYLLRVKDIDSQCSIGNSKVIIQ